MATFGKMETHIDPSDAGKTFPVETHVVFQHHNKKQTGFVKKQLKNAAIVQIDENKDNADLINHSNGVVVVNYKHLKKIQ